MDRGIQTLFEITDFKFIICIIIKRDQYKFKLQLHAPHYNTTPHYNLPEVLELATLESVTIGAIIILYQL